MSNTEHLAQYRRSARERREKHTSWLNTEILCGTKMALERLSLHYGLSQHEALDQSSSGQMNSSASQ